MWRRLWFVYDDKYGWKCESILSRRRSLLDTFHLGCALELRSGRGNGIASITSHRAFAYLCWTAVLKPALVCTNTHSFTLLTKEITVKIRKQMQHQTGTQLENLKIQFLSQILPWLNAFTFSLIGPRYKKTRHILALELKTRFLLLPGYSRAHNSSLSPRGYGSNGSTPHSSNGSSYSGTMNGYGSTGPLGTMGMTSSTANDYITGTTSEHLLPSVKSEAF